MKSISLIFKSFVISAFLASALPGTEGDYLELNDINRIMKQIFDQHVDKKEMSISILKNSFKVYIDQFDPFRMYLLEKEIHPFLGLDDPLLARYLKDYQQSKFSEYWELNEVIQQAIFRARNIRRALEAESLAFAFENSQNSSYKTHQEWSDPDLKKGFAKDEKELAARIKKEITQFFLIEKMRFGLSYVRQKQGQLAAIHERQLRSHENQYLFVNENGMEMNRAEKLNAFAMHVLKSLANSLDAHTTVLNPKEAYDMRIRLEKEMQGIGVGLDSTPKGFIITQLIKDGPAQKSGLVQLNDRLIEVNGVNVDGLPLSKVMELLRGKLGTTVSLQLARIVQEDAKFIEKIVKVTLMRREIAVDTDRVQSSYVTLNGGVIGKIKLNSFYQGDNGITSENDVRDAIKQLDKQGNLRGLILDLRENSGGFLSQAVKVAGLFITNGVIVVSKYFNGEEHFYRDMDGKIAFDGPLIILTSKATASAAEIVAQALQDYGVGIVVGDEHTYGKGTIQSQTVTENQASTFFKVTVGKYYTVSGKTPQIQGVKADIIVPSQFIHENIGEEYLDYPLQQDVISPAYNDNLSDITANLKPWYLRYYAPTLQHKKFFWSKTIPELKKKSEQRITQNKDYQRFIDGDNSPRGKKINPEDLQMAEAVSIMMDMIDFQTEMRGKESDLHGSSAQTAGVVRENDNR